MKKTVRIIGLCTLVMLAVMSCKKNEEGVTKTFRATLNPPTCDAKTYLGPDDYLYWNSGDAIKVYAEDSTSAVFTTNDNAVTVANFSGNIAQSDNYIGVYPAACFSDMDDEGRVTATILSTQQFVANSFATDTYFMAARSEDGSPSFDFQGLFGLLAIPMKGNATIGSIELTDAFWNLCGELSIKLNQIGKGNGDNLIEVSDSRDTGKTITLDFGAEGYTLSEGPVKAYFVLRPLACSEGFTIVVKDLNGDILLTKSATSNVSNAMMPETILLMPEITVNNLP